MRLLYSRDAVAPEGVERRNPRFFEWGGVEPAATHVIIDGDWPEIRDAYLARGVTVEDYQPPEDPTAPVAAPPAEPPPLVLPTAVDKALVHIPDGWRELPWVGSADKLTLRQLGALLSDKPVLNKAQATSAIEAEISRREAQPAPGAADAPAHAEQAATDDV